MIRRPLLQDHLLSERERKNLVILELIRRKGPITRTEISQGTDLNIVTVSNYVAHFMKEGLVAEKGLDISTGGRKPTLVELNTKAAYTIGLDLGTSGMPQATMIGMLVDLAGQVEHRVTIERSKETMEKVLTRAPELLEALLRSSKVDPKRIAGIGIGLGGVIDEVAGTVRDTSRGGVRSSYVALREALEAQRQMPVYVGNDATLAGYGEMRLGLTREVANMIYLYADVGAGLMINGTIYWGTGGSAGELTINRLMEEDATSWVKGADYLRSTGVDLGIPAQAKKLLGEGLQSTMTGLVGGNLDQLMLPQVIAAAKDGDSLAMELIEHAAINLGTRIAYLVNLFNPQVVVIGGGVEQAGSLLLEPVFRTVRRWAFEEPASQVDIVPAQLGADAVALGAASLVAREVFVQV